MTSRLCRRIPTRKGKKWSFRALFDRFGPFQCQNQSCATFPLGCDRLDFRIRLIWKISNNNKKMHCGTPPESLLDWFNDREFIITSSLYLNKTCLLYTCVDLLQPWSKPDNSGMFTDEKHVQTHWACIWGCRNCDDVWNHQRLRVLALNSSTSLVNPWNGRCSAVQIYCKHTCLDWSQADLGDKFSNRSLSIKVLQCMSDEFGLVICAYTHDLFTHRLIESYEDWDSISGGLSSRTEIHWNWKISPFLSCFVVFVYMQVCNTQGKNIHNKVLNMHESTGT